jgi:hypothetical protein
MDATYVKNADPYAYRANTLIDLVKTAHGVSSTEGGVDG